MFLRVCFGCHVLEGYGMTGKPCTSAAAQLLCNRCDSPGKLIVSTATQRSDELSFTGHILVPAKQVFLDVITCVI